MRPLDPSPSKRQPQLPKKGFENNADNQQSRLDLWRFLRVRIGFVCWGMILALCLFALIQQVPEASLGQTDFCQDYIVAQRIVKSTPIYSPLRCWAGFATVHTPVEYDTHPPFAAILSVPFGFLPKVPAYELWGGLCLVAYVVSGVLLLKELGWWSLRGLALFAICSLFWEIFTTAEQVQNFAQLLTLLIIGAWFLQGRGHERWAGILLGIAGLIKIWPAALLLDAIFQKRWQQVLIGGSVLILGISLTLITPGLGAYGTYLNVVQTNQDYATPNEGNISLVGAVARPLRGFYDPPLILPSLVKGMSATEATLLGEMLAGSVLVAALVFLWWAGRSQHSKMTELLRQGLLVTILQLVFPFNLYWGLIILLFPITLILLALRQLPSPPRWWFLLVGLSLLPLLKPSLSASIFPEWLLEHRGPGWSGIAVFLVGTPTYGLILFACLQAFLIWQISSQSQMQHSLVGAKTDVHNPVQSR